MTVTIMPPLTQLQILGLAPDPFVIKNAHKEVEPLKWTNLSRSGSLIWGEYPRPNGVPLRTKVNLDTMALACTCKSLKRPCRFVIALLLLWQREPDLFQPAELPEWMQQWIAETEPLQVLGYQGQNPHSADEYRNAIELMQAGMTEFGRWLRDIVGDGLAKLPERAKDLIDPMVDRLYDANANQVASDLKLIINQFFPKKGSPPPDWPQQVLRRFGRFYLITQAWERFDQLTKAQQVDLVVASGMYNLLSYDQEFVDDHWLVTGRRYELIGRQTQRRIWLYGLTSGRSALVIDDFGRQGDTVISPITGHAYPATVRYPLPQDGLIGRLGINGASELGQQLPGADQYFARLQQPTSIKQAQDHFSTTQTANPWLVHTPAFFSNVYIRKVKDQWYVIDRYEHALRLKHRSTQEWYLFAHSLGRELTLFGELRQNYFEPLSIWQEGQWQDLLAWGHL